MSSSKRKNIEQDSPKTTKHKKVEIQIEPDAELSGEKKFSSKRKNIEPDSPKTTKHRKVEIKTESDAELSGGKKCSSKRKNIEPDSPKTTKHRKVEINENKTELDAEKLSEFETVSLEPAEKEAFYMLLEDSKIKRFLKMDSTCRFSDQYFLAMAAIYFKRAKLTIAEYTRSNFFIALYLANLMEEDIPYYKEIILWAIGEKNLEGKKQFKDHLYSFLDRVGYRGLVTIQECHQIFSQDPDHWLWNRKRKPHSDCQVSYYNRGPNELCLTRPSYRPQWSYIYYPFPGLFPSGPFYILYPPGPFYLLFPSGPSNI